MSDKQRALGTLILIMHIHDMDDWDVVITEDCRCFVYNTSEEFDYTDKYRYLLKQARRNLILEGILDG